mmetsp:Transcript_3168/g.9653  ORF Transcript_3168/g.9653 Transcript_3168/m.9653 type:complete len:137 (+) Transcript_3168:566-976(+)
MPRRGHHGQPRQDGRAEVARVHGVCWRRRACSHFGGAGERLPLGRRRDSRLACTRIAMEDHVAARAATRGPETGNAAARIELNLCCERTDVSLDAAEADNGVELRKCVGHVRVRATQAIVEVRRLLCQINRVLSWT